MLGPTTLRRHLEFYPIGNTPAVNLLEYPASSGGNNDRAMRILSLGCGDPSNLLFTLWSYNECEKKLKWDFTCCDIEIAVLARNVFLYSLIIDEVPDTIMWNLFYHLWISESDLDALRAQVEKLLELCSSFERWSSSKYGKIVTLMNQDTFLQIKRIWAFYSKATDLKDVISGEFKSVLTQFETLYKTDIKAMSDKDGGNDTSMHGARSAGVHQQRSAETFATSIRRYWKTGVVAGNTDDLQNLEQSGGGRANPMMAFCSAQIWRCAVHHGSDPLLGFHLASAFDDANSDTEQLLEKSVVLAKSQFRNWCKAFRDHASAKKIIVRVFCGDALRLCYELQDSIGSEPRQRDAPSILRLYTCQWSSTALVLDGPEQSNNTSPYDVIDTSNLTDNLGILNILPAVVPLLSRRPTSVLFTDCITRAAKDKIMPLDTLLCSNVTALSLFLGLAPIGTLIGYTAYRDDGEALLDSTETEGSCVQHYVRIAWRYPRFGDRFKTLNGEEVMFHDLRIPGLKELAQFFFNLYRNMFANEDEDGGLNQQIRSTSGKLYYNRMSFVALLAWVRSRVARDRDIYWTPFSIELIKKITSDESLTLGASALQEVHVMFRLFNLHSTEIIKNPRKLKADVACIRSPEEDTGLLSRKKSVPPIVWVVLTVPREKMQYLFSAPESVSGQINITHAGIKDSYFSMQSFFGAMRYDEKSNRWDVVKKDGWDWEERSDVIVTCAAPAWTLLTGPKQDIRVELAISATPSNETISIYGCGLEDGNLVILKDPPGLKDSQSLLPIPQIFAFEEHETCTIRMMDDSSGVDGMFAMGGPKNPTIPKDFRIPQISPCGASMRIINKESRNENIEVSFPLPIDRMCYPKISPHTHQLEIATKSSMALTLGGYDFNPFPLFISKSHICSLTLPKVNLSQLPEIPTSTTNLEWLEIFMSSRVTPREHRFLSAAVIVHEEFHFTMAKDIVTPESRIKVSLQKMFQAFYGLHLEDRIQTFQLEADYLLLDDDDDDDNDDDKTDTMIFASALRHNPSQSSIVLDAYILPLTKLRHEKLAPIIQHLDILRIKMQKQEEVSWKNMLPSSVEACRQTWAHKEKCQYRARDATIPLSTTHGASAICSCGQGRDLDAFPRFDGWEQVARWATRVALVPLSGLPYMEEMPGTKDVEVMRARVCENRAALLDMQVVLSKGAVEEIEQGILDRKVRAAKIGEGECVVENQREDAR
ncbi:hypothetical protein NHQ30_006170 [Ciborinia camelliae]|nr:hypothetical protein NHQ30_006170 [Ciborinia camelliae]